MKKLTNLLRVAMVAVAAIAMAACDEGSESKGDDAKLNQELVLEVDVDNITATTAKVKVTHNGLATDTWYGFLTEDVYDSEEELIAMAAEQFAAEGTGEGLRKSKSYVTVLKELTPDTAYKYIAFGMTAEGVVYGSSASVEFTTEASGSSGDENESGDQTVNGMTLHSAWTLRYIGAGTLYEQKFDHIVEVKSTDTNPYVVTVVYASEYDPKYLRELGEELIVQMKEYLAYFNQANNTTYTLNDMLYRGDGAEAFDLEPGYYKAVAIGVKADGTLSGLYSTSDTFEVKTPIATDAYKAWLGEWTILGANNVTNSISLTTKMPNKSLYMVGWSNISDWSVEVEYNSDLDSLFFYSQLVAEDVDFGTEYGVGDVYFLGFDDDDYFYTTGSGDYYICIAGILDTGARGIARYGVGVTDYPQFNRMSFMAHIGDEYYSIADLEKDVLTYPALFVESAQTTSAAEHLKGNCCFAKLRSEREYTLIPIAPTAAIEKIVR
ncbi:MAG: hypothetical protein IJX65_07395 [Alistipes sp.]|nr:hypothetical protein [Alistipes sp.]